MSNHLICIIASLFVAGCNQDTLSNVETKSITCTAGPIQDYGVGGEMALIATQKQKGYALAFAVGTGPNNATPYGSTLLLLDRNGQVQKTVPLGAGAFPQVVLSSTIDKTPGANNRAVYGLTTFQTTSAVETATGWMDEDGGNFRQYRLPSDATFASPIFISGRDGGLSRLAWLDEERDVLCSAIDIGMTMTNDKIVGGHITSPTLRDGKCLYGKTNDLEAFAAGNESSLNVIAVHQVVSNADQKLSLFIGQTKTPLQETLLAEWGGHDENHFVGEMKIVSGAQGSDRILVSYQQSLLHGAEVLIAKTRLMIISDNGMNGKTLEVPHFVSFDTDASHVATISLEDDNTKSAFFHLMDMRGNMLQNLKLDTVETKREMTAKIVSNGDRFFAVWGGGLTTDDSLGPIHGSVIDCSSCHDDHECPANYVCYSGNCQQLQ